ncbi:hypothetical protein IJ182_09200 [bacterium]|nr:hypothetical protein [bacterium]
MKISAPVITPNFERDYNKNNNILSPLKRDTVSFSKSFSPFLYGYSWYLNKENIVTQDDFSTTVVDKERKRKLKDIFNGKTYTKKIYDLPLRLREELSETNKDTVVSNIPNDVMIASGLSNNDFIKSIDKINSFINIIYPRYDKDEDRTQQKFKMKLGNTVATVTRITQGLSGIIYKIEIPNCKPLCLKHFINIFDTNLSEGAFPEISLAKKMNEDNVKDIPLLYCANPYNGWMLSEFITSDYKSRKDGISFNNYLKRNNLVCNDVNEGMTVGGKDANIYVDFGYIYSKESDRDTKGFHTKVNEDRKNNANRFSQQSIEKTSIMSSAENIFLYGDDKVQDSMIKEYHSNPEFHFLSEVTEAVENILSGKRISSSLAMRLQKHFEEIGFIGDALDIISTCKQ